MKSSTRWIVPFVGLAFLTGCTIRLVDFTVISSKNVKVPSKARGARASAQDCNFIFPPNMKEAIDRAIEGAGGEYDALVDGVVYQTVYPFVACFKVEGTPINTKASTSMNEFEGKELWRHSHLSEEPVLKN